MDTGRTNELSAFIQGGEITDQLEACQFVEMNSAAWTDVNTAD
jgi:hypothetical protein